MNSWGKHSWTEQHDKILIKALKEGCDKIQLENRVQKSYVTILNRLKDMGFEGIRDARRVLKK